MAADTLLAFDYGEKNIGVAVGNTSTGQAHPLTTVRVTRQQPDWDCITGLIKEWKPAALVIGLPLTMDGGENPVTPKARKFGNKLNGRYNLPIHMVDERLTTREARTQLFDAGVPQHRHAALLDQLAAQKILQTYLSGLTGPAY